MVPQGLTAPASLARCTCSRRRTPITCRRSQLAAHPVSSSASAARRAPVERPAQGTGQQPGLPGHPGSLCAACQAGDACSGGQRGQGSSRARQVPTRKEETGCTAGAKGCFTTGQVGAEWRPSLRSTCSRALQLESHGRAPHVLLLCSWASAAMLQMPQNNHMLWDSISMLCSCSFAPGPLHWSGQLDAPSILLDFVEDSCLAKCDALVRPCQTRCSCVSAGPSSSC